MLQTLEEMVPKVLPAIDRADMFDTTKKKKPNVIEKDLLPPTWNIQTMYYTNKQFYVVNYWQPITCTAKKEAYVFGIVLVEWTMSNKTQVHGPWLIIQNVYMLPHGNDTKIDIRFLLPSCLVVSVFPIWTPCTRTSPRGLNGNLRFVARFIATNELHKRPMRMKQLSILQLRMVTRASLSRVAGTHQHWL